MLLFFCFFLLFSVFLFSLFHFIRLFLSLNYLFLCLIFPFFRAVFFPSFLSLYFSLLLFLHFSLLFLFSFFFPYFILLFSFFVLYFISSYSCLSLLSVYHCGYSRNAARLLSSLLPTTSFTLGTRSHTPSPEQAPRLAFVILLTWLNTGGLLCIWLHPTARALTQGGLACTSVCLGRG